MARFSVGEVSKDELSPELQNEINKIDIHRVSAHIARGSVQNVASGNLDEIKQEGNYIVVGADITNKPSEMKNWGTLMVYQGGTGAVVQDMIEEATSRRWYRHFQGSVWRAWIEIQSKLPAEHSFTAHDMKHDFGERGKLRFTASNGAGYVQAGKQNDDKGFLRLTGYNGTNLSEFNIHVDEDKANINNQRIALVSRTLKTTGVSSGFNFNNAISLGVWRVAWNSGETSLANSPCGNTAGLLIVSEGSHDKWIVQQYNSQDGRIFCRHSVDANGTRAWQPWKEVCINENPPFSWTNGWTSVDLKVVKNNKTATINGSIQNGSVTSTIMTGLPRPNQSAVIQFYNGSVQSVGTGYIATNGAMIISQQPPANVTLYFNVTYTLA